MPPAISYIIYRLQLCYQLNRNKICLKGKTFLVLRICVCQYSKYYTEQKCKTHLCGFLYLLNIVPLVAHSDRERQTGSFKSVPFQGGVKNSSSRLSDTVLQYLAVGTKGNNPSLLGNRAILHLISPPLLLRSFSENNL